jgi:Flp pilus assembly pilin Flp
MVAAIAAILVAIVFALGNVVSGAFNQTCSAIAQSASPASTC